MRKFKQKPKKRDGIFRNTFFPFEEDAALKQKNKNGKLQVAHRCSYPRSSMPPSEILKAEIALPRLQSKLQESCCILSELMTPAPMGLKSDPIYKIWYPFILTDEAMMHAMIFFLATVLDRSYRQAVSMDWRTHASQAARLISERLSSEKLATTDASIAAVIVLATAEFVAGNLNAFDVHMDGVARMVELRGGLTALESYPFLKRKIRQVDVARAVLCVSQPRFPLVESRRPCPALNTIYSGLGATCGQGMFQLTQQYSILYDLIEVFGDVYDLITVITSSQEEGSPRMDPIFFLDSTSSILHRLTTSSAPTGCDNDSIHLYECCRLGTLLFTRGISEQSVWPPPTRSALFNHVKESLRSHINDDCSWINLKLWTLFMAGVTATGPGLQINQLNSTEASSWLN